MVNSLTLQTFQNCHVTLGLTANSTTHTKMFKSTHPLDNCNSLSLCGLVCPYPEESLGGGELASLRSGRTDMNKMKFSFLSLLHQLHWATCTAKIEVAQNLTPLRAQAKWFRDSICALGLNHNITLHIPLGDAKSGNSKNLNFPIKLVLSVHWSHTWPLKSILETYILVTLESVLIWEFSARNKSL